MKKQDYSSFLMNYKRVRQLNDIQESSSSSPIVYWMNRDQRSQDNWALLFAQEKALEKKSPVVVVFCLRTSFKHATDRMVSFLLEGLEETAKSLAKHNISFQLLLGNPKQELPSFLSQIKAQLLITEFTPYRRHRNWREELTSLSLPFYEVDTRNIVPCWIASEKQEWGAYTLRPKIHKQLEEFLTPIPPLKKHPYALSPFPLQNFLSLKGKIEIDTSIPPSVFFSPGEKKARVTLDAFLQNTSDYSQDRNDPNKTSTSQLSPYLHFGHISSQRIALEVQKSELKQADKDAFLEELIVRRELSDNYCYYNKFHKEFTGFPTWAQETLNQHRKDKRPYLYTLEELETAKTYDPLWNASQLEMVKTGKMHGYMRMYWAKKILEWTATPEEAQEIAIYLNDRYELDGRDTNGYTGIAWSIGGVHDRAWFERPVFGKIRYMNFKGASKKFDIKAYIDAIEKSA